MNNSFCTTPLGILKGRTEDETIATGNLYLSHVAPSFHPLPTVTELESKTFHPAPE